MLPEPEALDSILTALRFIDPTFQIVCDLRGLENIYNDIPESIQVLSRFDAHLIARPSEADFLNERFGDAVRLLRTNGQRIALRYAPIGPIPFLDDPWVSDKEWKPFADIAGPAIPSQQEWEYLKATKPHTAKILATWTICAKTGKPAFRICGPTLVHLEEGA